MRSSFGVRARVWFRIQDSGTLQRFANSAESSNSTRFPRSRDINGTSAISRLIVSIPYRCIAVTVTAISQGFAFDGRTDESERPPLGCVLEVKSHPRPRQGP